MILIAPYARGLQKGGTNPKNYPHWDQLMTLIHQQFPGESVIQVGVESEDRIPMTHAFHKNLTLPQLAELVKSCRVWVSVDSFFQHFCWDLGKPGVVIFSRSDPLIFGHPENINLLKSRAYLREKQFWLWDQDQIVPDSYVSPQTVVEALKKFV